MSVVANNLKGIRQVRGAPISLPSSSPFPSVQVCSKILHVVYSDNQDFISAKKNHVQRPEIVRVMSRPAGIAVDHTL